MSNGTTTVLRGSIDMSLCPDTTPSSSAAMAEQSADVSSTPLHAHAVSWVSTSSTTCRMYSTEQPLYLPDAKPRLTETFSQTNGRKNSRATHPAFCILMTRNRGDAYRFRAFRAQNRGFCALLPSNPPIFGLPEHKMVLRQISCCQVTQVWKILIQRSRSEARPYILLLIHFILLFRPSISPLLIEYFMAFLMGEMSRWTLFTKLTTSP